MSPAFAVPSAHARKPSTPISTFSRVLKLFTVLGRGRPPGPARRSGLRSCILWIPAAPPHCAAKMPLVSGSVPIPSR